VDGKGYLVVVGGAQKLNTHHPSFFFGGGGRFCPCEENCEKKTP